MKKLAILSSLLLLALNSCSNEDIINEELPNNFEKRISVVAEDLVPAHGTRTSYTDNGNGYSFAWSEGDALGIFPENGYQTAFPISEGKGVGTNTALFDGGDWALKANKTYAAYYPLIKEFELDPTSIPVDYTGQIQNGNGSTSHLSAYDFMASNYTEVDAKGNVNFKLQHLGCLVQFVLNMPEEDTYSSMEIVSDKTPFITSGEYSLSDNSHVLTKVQESQEITIGLENVSTTADNKTLTITAMFAPVDLSESRLTLTIKGSSKDYTIIMRGQNLQTGKAVAVGGINDTTPYVTFQAEAEQTFMMSKEVEALEYSVNNSTWTLLGTNTVTFGGSNGDLRLRGSNGYGTATDISDYSTVIFGTEASVGCSGDIRTLADYANYLTEDTSDDLFCNLFELCSSLASAPELPAKKMALGCYLRMFSGCTSLTSAPELPADILAKNCYMSMFSDCTALSSAPVLPAETAINGCYSGMFSGCTSLTSAPELPAEKVLNGCYFSMFSGCTSLTSAPELPAKVLASQCYQYMFSGCTSLTNAPELPAETLASNCYYQMFRGCTSLISAPELSAATLADYCYSGMFQECSSLTTAPALPAKSLSSYCYFRMFVACTSLTNAPEIQAEILADHCCQYMFGACTSLTSAPELPAKTLADSCYYEMFRDCSSLTSAPELLPAEVLTEGCYYSMFKYCTSLEHAPKLLAETLASFCYYEMFRGCTSLTNAPELPAKILSEACYSFMFYRCTSLEHAPVLPAKTLVGGCYSHMFDCCYSLNYIKMMAIDIPDYSLTRWVSSVSPMGTFVKSPEDTPGLKSGSDGIPLGWTVEYADE